MKAKDVFTPGRFPTHTYVDDHLKDKSQQLRDALDDGSMLVSISGPSKSGKTVFVEHILGKDNLIEVTGAGIHSSQDLWIRVFDIVGTPILQTNTSTKTLAGTVGGKGTVEGSVLIAKSKSELSVNATYTTQQSSKEGIAVDMLQLLIKEFAGTDFVVFIDDFHYVPRDVQSELAQQIKEAIRQGVKIICASVPYHSDDVIRSNPDLRGRIFSIDFDYWGNDILRKIAFKGFNALNIDYQTSMVDAFALEAAGSPQLMQYLCLNACYELNVRERSTKEVKLSFDDQLLSNICRRTVLSTDYSSVVDKMIEGPKTRGSDRKIYITKYGWQGDVYRLLLKAIALDPPQLNFRYQSLVDRISSICSGESPSGSSITSACYHATSIGNDAAGDNIIEWDSDNDVLDIRDPYFIFYLRWSEVIDDD